jgi:plastocyanin
MLFQPGVAGAATITVTVGNNCFCFSPSSVTIHPGDTVQWTWSSSGHSTTSGTQCTPNGLWDTGILSQGATFSRTFNTAGSFPYYCSAHCSFGMVGTVTVMNPMATPTPTPTPTATPAGTPTPTPAVTTNPATNVASFSATLNGSLNPRGSTTTVDFQYGFTTSYGSTTPAQTQTGNTVRAISANITGLMASHVYHFRIVAHNAGGTTFGSDRTFTTLSATGPPVVTTNPATFIASFSATLNGSLDPHGLATTVHFQYGTTTSYGLTTAPQSRNGNTYLNISAGISSLTASTIYHYRIVASNSAGTRSGADRTFTTLTATGPPVVTTNPATNVATSSATLNGSLDPHGLTTTVSFQYGTTTSYGHTTAMQSQTGNTYRNIAANISGLTTHTTYHFRIVATNGVGTKMGSDRTLTTP